MNDDTPCNADSVGMALIQCSRAHRNRANALLGGMCDRVHAGQEGILDALSSGGALPQSELVARLAVEPPTITRMLQRMQREGLITRQPDPEDGRVQLVALTETGQAAALRAQAVWRTLEAEAVAGLSVAEQLLLQRLLRSVRQNLEK